MFCVIFFFEWFVKVRGIVMGIVYVGMGVGGVVCFFIIDGFLKCYSYKIIMIFIGVGFGIIGFILLIFICYWIFLISWFYFFGKRWYVVDWFFMKSIVLMVGLVIIFFISFGNFVFSFWLLCKLYLFGYEVIVYCNFFSFCWWFKFNEI